MFTDGLVKQPGEFTLPAHESDRPRVAIVVSSRHGSTLGIAGALAQAMVSRGATVTVAEPDDVDLTGADAVVIGSAVYVGRWLKSARRFVEHRSLDLIGVPTWLFSSGPLGDDDESGLDADHVRWLLRRTQAVEHREFAGRFEPSELGPVEKLVARSLRAPAGDFRDWDEIREWADHITDGVLEQLATAATTAN